MNRFKEFINSNDQNKIIYLVLSFLFVIKLLTIWYFGGRNIGLEHPFITMYFEPFHRFTDFLMIWDIVHNDNIYDYTNTPTYKFLSPAPYGFIQMFLMGFPLIKSASYGAAYLYFLILVIITFFLSYFLHSKIQCCQKIDSWIFIFSILFMSYPFGFLVDRGNTDIFALIFILSLMITIILFDRLNLLKIICVSILASLKPVFLVYLASYYFSDKFKYFVFASFLTLISYFIPILFFNADYDYLLKAINDALPHISNQIKYCNSLSCTLRLFDLTISKKILILFAFIYLFSSFIFDKIFLKLKDTFQKFFYYFSISTIMLLIFNDPSPDYRLTFLLPFFIVILANYHSFSFQNRLLSLFSFFLIFSFTNISIPGVPAFDTFLKFNGLILYNILLIRTINNLKKIN